MYDYKKNKNLLGSVMSSTKELVSSTFEDSDAISLKDAFHRNSFIEPIQKEESSILTHSFMIPTQTKSTSADKSEKGNNSEVFLCASSKCSEIASARDCIKVEKIDNADDAWRWICGNIWIVQEVTRGGNCWYHSFIGACKHTRSTFGVNLPDMRSTKQFLLNTWKDLKQLYNENCNIFIEGNGKQDKPSFGCREDVNNMFYNPLFEFDKFLVDPSKTFSILMQIDNAIGKEIYNKEIEDSFWFPIKDENYCLMLSGKFHLLPTNIKQA